MMDGKLLSVMLDGGSCTNIVSFDVVKKLRLSTVKHSQPYNLHWLKDYGAIKVNKMAKARFHIGEYANEVWCDVAPIQLIHYWAVCGNMILELLTAEEGLMQFRLTEQERDNGIARRGIPD
ncbi:unnamed protein product [Linum trigynum]|uniref:Uncharacterized protein n=1 Tax=Linum trigynum TaxID=586398 RepID=A0AAV2FL11_9ROSI